MPDFCGKIYQIIFNNDESLIISRKNGKLVDVFITLKIVNGIVRFFIFLLERKIMMIVTVGSYIYIYYWWIVRFCATLLFWCHRR